MSTFDELKRSVTLHLVVAERAALLMEQAAHCNPDWYEGVRWNGPTVNDKSLPSASYDFKILREQVQHALTAINRLEREVPDEEPSTTAEREGEAGGAAAPVGDGDGGTLPAPAADPLNHDTTVGERAPDTIYYAG